MSIPKGWLCYLAPEIMRSLTVYQSEGDDLPFTKASDIFAFGTVWFEMLTGEWPWKTIGPESIIWLVGRGMKPSLANLQASRDVKDILVMCWTYNADHRPDFTHLSKMLEKIPKKRLARYKFLFVKLNSFFSCEAKFKLLNVQFFQKSFSSCAFVSIR